MRVGLNNKGAPDMKATLPIAVLLAASQIAAAQTTGAGAPKAAQLSPLTVTGIASSPEFVFAVAPGDILPEPRRFGVIWMGREALGRALDLDGHSTTWCCALRRRPIARG